MNKMKISRGLKIAVIASLAVSVVSFAVMTLWNGVVPPVIGWHQISFVQAFALLVLSRILLGGWHKRGGHHMQMRCVAVESRT